ncbi:PREDICTED: dnaJ homolog dnj-5 [Nicrophorus vespilloides]|uniref:DnaJ homolog dnj-5 n=1 Tax=Nicrophorus vespilloides TaxID=110193 RepID=A0ABM1M417_NICVS|nr:PREDICTED: dnaJ homolog dnj-5 [Nicrophorus vespilloides]
MSDSSRKTSNGAVEQIMRNMTSDIQNADGQYIQLGFTPPATPQEPWNSMPQTSFIPPFNMRPAEHSMPSYQPMEQFPQQPVSYNYMSQSNFFNQDTFEPPNLAYPSHQDVQYQPDYKLFLAHKNSIDNFNDNAVSVAVSNPISADRSPLIDNLFGNWTPNTSGTYSPFGNVPSFNANHIFEPQPPEFPSRNLIRQVIDEPPKFSLDEQPSFQFNRDTKKPRIVAEVKPMRPSYSDVLLKSAPQTNVKLNKTEGKETRQKKDIKKNTKNEKQKTSATLSRSNTTNEIKDITADKAATLSKNSEKNKDVKNCNLNRKWASLDNVTQDTSNDFKTDFTENKKPKKPQENINKSASAKLNPRKVSKNDNTEIESGNSKGDTVNNNKSSTKRGNKGGNKQRGYENNYGSNEKPPGKRSQRNRKKDNPVPFGIIGLKLKEYLGWWKYIVKFLFWLLHLISDILSLSSHLIQHWGSNLYIWLVIHWALFLETSVLIAKRMKVFTWFYDKFKKEKEPEKKAGFVHPGLHNNINMPTTGEEAMKRLLACKGKDPYSILGVTPMCTDADIKNYYKKQAKLVHPDKNQQPGAEEAFKILVHAFDMIGEPERRAAYDRGVAESAHAKQAMTELTELLVQLQQKVEAAANTIRCSACGLRHKRIKVDRPCYAARNCATCKIHHSAKEGDIWAEARCFGFLWHYYACMDGGVYDITEWAACQKDSLKHLKPDTHNVQYRIALGKQNSSPPRRNAGPSSQGSAANTTNNSTPNKNPDLDKLFNSFCNHNAENLRRKSKKAK